MTRCIPFDAINAAALPQLPSLLREWFPNGKREGHEWRVGSINGEGGESFSVNMHTGKWAEFNGWAAASCRPMPTQAIASTVL
jgi:putative DNA primase/helicase